ncbi:MAG: hypothetical protein ABIT37_03825 [Luteolibacter sp.]
MNSADFKKSSAPHPDGFGGARDASILESSHGWKSGMMVPATIEVQATVRNKDLLVRAGWPARGQKRHTFYPVKVRHDEQFNRLQLA